MCIQKNNYNYVSNNINNVQCSMLNSYVQCSMSNSCVQCSMFNVQYAILSSNHVYDSTSMWIPLNKLFGSLGKLAIKFAQVYVCVRIPDRGSGRVSKNLACTTGHT